MTKQNSKNVIDYDPLAWLDDSDDDFDSSNEKESKKKASSEKSSNQKISSKKSSSKKRVAASKKKVVSPKNKVAASKKKVVSPKNKVAASKKKVVAPKKKVATKKSAIKKPTIKKAISTKSKMNDNNNQEPNTTKGKASPIDNDAGFGFFNDEPVPEIKAMNVQKLKANEVDEGFGFFDDEPESSQQENNMQSDEDKPAFGFFDGVPSDIASTTAGPAKEGDVVQLGSELTIRCISTCKEIIDDSIASDADLKISIAGLQKIDTAGLQLIFSLVKTLEKTSQSIEWLGDGGMINDGAKMLGLPELVKSGGDESSFGFF